MVKRWLRLLSIRSFDKYEKTKSTVNICVKGEGEIVFHDLIQLFAKNRMKDLHSVNGVVFRQGEAIRENKTETISVLDDLPFPDYSSIDFEKYIHHPFLYLNRTSTHKRNISVMTSRGCPFNCVFCSVHLHMGKKFRSHSVEYVISHIVITKENNESSNMNTFLKTHSQLRNFVLNLSSVYFLEDLFT